RPLSPRTAGKVATTLRTRVARQRSKPSIQLGGKVRSQLQSSSWARLDPKAISPSFGPRHLRLVPTPGRYSQDVQASDYATSPTGKSTTVEWRTANSPRLGGRHRVNADGIGDLLATPSTDKLVDIPEQT